VQQRVRERCNAEVATASEKPRGPGCSGEQQTQGCERERRDQQLRGEVVVGTLTDEQRSTLFGRLFLPLDLNSASSDEIMLIPGMTARMAHEFEEYRPYTSLEQFRREIGKYVDANEVARLERYVTRRIDFPEAAPAGRLDGTVDARLRRHADGRRFGHERRRSPGRLTRGAELRDFSARPSWAREVRTTRP
jgi:hypothetical protein